ncbi:PIG-L deacetylase family protein [Gordonia insulae]|uniref:N-acetyl-alpha-D-glucosaminyl L-malate deacetylase 1 n=1 Tax=Gordonia insulae TaxID=2420509 RepID=A0A3G8JTU1_9ACTN|nr:PIG-L family deacetylase [Gordonia insulae]AZG48135.1 N-acetyl-alpha-D-glucosaminyl L-malate deacetylase 1 [Gordonia insulae]
MIDLTTTALTEVVVLGAHCDDIAIGMGGTLLTMARARPGLRVRALVLTGGGTEREAEERAALAAFCPGATVDLTVLDFPDGRSPAYWGAVKDALGVFRRTSAPDVVFAPQRHDAHQDHRTLAELVPTEFRDHLILGYEILKWETDTPQPTLFHPITTDVAQEKVRLLHEHYPSQVAHDWFDDLSFLGLSRLRGVQCRHPHAEAFVLEKALLTLGGE